MAATRAARRLGHGEVVLVRHAETRWSREGRHTGRTDVPLSDDGRARARALAGALGEERFELVLVSPSRRARETCELSGLGAEAVFREELVEWDYGAYEGLTSVEIEASRPGWSLWREGCPDGEDALAVGARADLVIATLADTQGPAVIFSHGHLLRVLAARWLALEPAQGSLFALSTASISLLGSEHGGRVIWHWNRVLGGGGGGGEGEDAGEGPGAGPGEPPGRLAP